MILHVNSEYVQSLEILVHYRYKDELCILKTALQSEILKYMLTNDIQNNIHPEKNKDYRIFTNLNK